MHMLVCSIGSRKCRDTLRFGAEIAIALKASTVFMGIFKSAQREKRVRQALDELEGWLADKNLTAEIQFQSGNAETIILHEAQSGHYDLVALGALGKQRSWRALLASVAIRMLERARCSVLMIQGPPRSLDRVLICTAGHSVSRPVVQMGATLSRSARAEATLLHVTNAVPAMYTGLEQMDENLADFLQSGTEIASEVRWAASVLEAECKPAKVKLRHGTVANEILAEARSSHSDLIVIGSSQAGNRLARYLLSDISYQVVTRATCPVLVVASLDQPEVIR